MGVMTDDIGNALDSWTAAVCRQLGIGDSLNREELLDTARDVAHLVARPATPLTTYLMGIAVGRGAHPSEVNAAIRSLMATWSPASPGS